MYCYNKEELLNSEQSGVYNGLEQSKIIVLKSFNGHLFLGWNVNCEALSFEVAKTRLLNLT